jgi:hypothetical protein
VVGYILSPVVRNAGRDFKTRLTSNLSRNLFNVSQREIFGRLGQKLPPKSFAIYRPEIFINN